MFSAVELERFQCSESNEKTSSGARSGRALVGQAEHAFYLWEERERFAFVALADARRRRCAPPSEERYGLAECTPISRGC